MSVALQEVELSKVQDDEFVHFGDVLQLVHVDSSSVLAVDVSDADTRPGEQSVAATAAPQITTPCARNSVVLTRYVPPPSSPLEPEYGDDVLRYGQKVQLAAHPLASGQDVDAQGGARPLRLFSKPISTTHFAKYCRHQLVGFTYRNSFDTGARALAKVPVLVAGVSVRAGGGARRSQTHKSCVPAGAHVCVCACAAVWEVVTPDPQHRALSTGLEVLAGAPVLLIHSATQKPLVVSGVCVWGGCWRGTRLPHAWRQPPQRPTVCADGMITGLRVRAGGEPKVPERLWHGAGAVGAHGDQQGHEVRVRDDQHRAAQGHHSQERLERHVLGVHRGQQGGLAAAAQVSGVMCLEVYGHAPEHACMHHQPSSEVVQAGRKTGKRHACGPGAPRLLRRRPPEAGTMRLAMAADVTCATCVPACRRRSKPSPETAEAVVSVVNDLAARHGGIEPLERKLVTWATSRMQLPADGEQAAGPWGMLMRDTACTTAARW